MRKVSTLPNLALRDLKIVSASKKKYTADKKGLNVCLLKLHSTPLPTHTHTHTHRHTRTHTQTIQTTQKLTKPSTNKPNPKISHKSAIPPTNHQQTSHITHNPAKYQTNYPLIFISQILNSSFPEDIFYDSGHTGHKNHIFHPTTLLPNPREKRNRNIFLSF